MRDPKAMLPPSMEKPLIVFVPGLWVGPDDFKSVIALLHKNGYRTAVAGLVSTGHAFDPYSNPPGPTIFDDVAAVRQTVSSLVERNGGTEIILCMHAAGGIIGSMALRGLTRSARKKAGKRGGVTKLAFCAAILAYMGLEWPHLKFDAEGNMWCRNPRILLFNDIDDDSEAEKHVSTLKGQPGHGYIDVLKGRAEPLYYAWRDDDVQSTYLLCKRDNVLLPKLQDRLATEAGCAFIEECEAGHMVTITDPDSVARFIRITAGERALL